MRAELSDRESEVWALLNTPMTYVEIGERLFISPRTVESHVDSLRRKLGATNRRELAWMWADGQHDAGLPTELSSFVSRDSELGQTAVIDVPLHRSTGPRRSCSRDRWLAMTPDHCRGVM